MYLGAVDNDVRTSQVHKLFVQRDDVLKLQRTPMSKQKVDLTNMQVLHQLRQGEGIDEHRVLRQLWLFSKVDLELEIAEFEACYIGQSASDLPLFSVLLRSVVFHSRTIHRVNLLSRRAPRLWHSMNPPNASMK